MSQKYASLQTLRFIAAFAVLITHSTFYTSERYINIPLYDNGVNGVGLFFTISGFVMIISSQKLIGMPGGWKTFLKKRLIRIVPIYFLFNILKVVVMFASNGLVKHTVLDIPYIIKSFFFLPALNADGKFFPLYGVGWTLNFEMFYYLLFTIALASKKNPIIFTSFFFIPLAILSFYTNKTWPDVRFYCNILVLNFIYGMLAAWLITGKKTIVVPVALLMVVAGLCFLFIPALNSQPKSIVGLATFILIYGAASADKQISRYLPSFVIFLGGASYSLYLIHPTIAPIIPTLFNKLHISTPMLSVAGCIVAAIVSACIFYKLVELPLTAVLSKRFDKRQKQKVNKELFELKAS